MLRSVLMWAAVLATSASAGKSNFINFKSFVCPREDRALGRCLRDMINSQIPRLANGLPQYGIPPCEPLLVPEVELHQSRGVIAVAAKYKDLAVRGPSTIKIKDIKVDRQNRTVVAHLHVPQLRIKGRYQVTGQAMMMPISGEGICTGNYSDIDATVTIELGRRHRESGVDALSCEDLQIDIDVADSRIRLENLFDGDQQMGGVMNRLINDNWQQVGAELQPAIEMSLKNFIKPLADYAFSKLDADEILD